MGKWQLTRCCTRCGAHGPDLLVLHAPGERVCFRPTSTCGAQQVEQHRALPLPGVPCAQLNPLFQIGCATGACLTGLWSVRGWTLMCCSETRWFCHYSAPGSEGHREVLVWVQNRRQQGQSGRHDNIDDSCAPATRGLDEMFPSVCQDVHAKMSAPSFATERTSPGARVVCDLLLLVLFERWYLDFEELQTHHIWQFILTYKRCRVTNIRVHAFRQITTEGQSYLDELVADGKTAPKAALTRSSTFRIRCGDDGFQQVSFDVQHHSCTGDLHQVRTKEPRVSYTGDNFARLSSVLNKFLKPRQTSKGGRLG